MNNPYVFHPDIVLRTPQKKQALNISGYSLADEFCKDVVAMEALYLASPVLHSEVVKYSGGKVTSEKEIRKLQLSLTKYYLRMSNRCTPFGLFSGCSVVKWSENESEIILNKKALDRHTRFDMHYLCALAQHLAMQPFIKEKLLYFPNSSWYKKAEEIRYVEYKYIGGRRNHLITAVMASEYVMNILEAATAGIKPAAIVAMLVDDEITHDEALEFVHELIDSQLLVNELEPAVTGDEFLYQIIRTLKKIHTDNNHELENIVFLLEKVEHLLKNIDAAGQNEISAYTEVIECVKQFGIPFEANKLFQTDVSFSAQKNELNKGLQENIMGTVELMNQLNAAHENPHLVSFCKRFYERYEDAEMPLLEILDTESGIGYLENSGDNILPLVDDMVVTGRAGEQQMKFTRKDKYLMDKLMQVVSSGAYSIELDPAEMAIFKNGWELLPPSLAVTFRLTDGDRVFIEHVGGSSAANLLGRFAHSNEEIHTLVNDIVAKEDEQNDAIIFAEITHLPESRIGNILLHPAFRKYEIPFLAKSSVELPYQIALQDLFISVKNNRVILRSKKLNKQIIPRLSTAHNYTFKALPIYQFLCDLQMQGKQSAIHFNWGTLENQFDFLPRVTHQQCIIFPATWKFEKKHIASLVNLNGEKLQTAVAEFITKWKLPKLVVLADSDNELLINLDDELMIETWLDAVKNRGVFIIKEFLNATVSSPVKDTEGNIYANQFIATLVKNVSCHGTPEKMETIRKKTVQQNFSPGTEWVYFKMYCGVKTADLILKDAIYPLVNILLQEKKISSFFFIRYADPDFHLRIRFQVTDVEHVGTVMRLFNEYTHPFEEMGSIWKIQLESYKRELDRYGQDTIALAEQLFFHDSMAVLDFLQQTEGDQREHLRWLWAIKAVDSLLNDFEIADAEKYTLLEQTNQSFHAEYNSDKFLKEQLSNKYRSYRKRVENILNEEQEESGEMMIGILKEKSIKIKEIVAEIKLQTTGQLPGIGMLLTSYIHMLVNRIVAANPRLHELVIYDMLFSHYKSAIARKKKASKEKIPLNEATLC